MSDEQTPTEEGAEEQPAADKAAAAAAGGEAAPEEAEAAEQAAETGEVELDDLGPEEGAEAPVGEATDISQGEDTHSASELEAVFDVPVKVQAVLGRSNLEVSQLLKLSPGAVVELDRKVGEAIDIYVNNRLVARGEVVMVEDHLGVTMTEIIKGARR